MNSEKRRATQAAGALAGGAVDAKLAAYAQIVGPITSVHRWEGAVQTDQEWRIEIKTAADKVADLIEHIKANHSHDTPEIVATPITSGSAEYQRVQGAVCFGVIHSPVGGDSQTAEPRMTCENSIR